MKFSNTQSFGNTLSIKKKLRNIVNKIILFVPIKRALEENFIIREERLTKWINIHQIEKVK